MEHLVFLSTMMLFCLGLGSLVCSWGFFAFQNRKSVRRSSMKTPERVRTGPRPPRQEATPLEVYWNMLGMPLGNLRKPEPSPSDTFPFERLLMEDR